MTKPATQRVESIHARKEEALEEIRDIENGDAPEKTIIDGEEFSHREWLVCEAESLSMDCRRMLTVMNAEGEIPYDDPYDEEAMSL